MTSPARSLGVAGDGQDRKTWTWSEFLAGVTAEDPRDNDAGNRFWPKQDMAAMLDTWGSQVSREDLWW